MGSLIGKNATVEASPTVVIKLRFAGHSVVARVAAHDAFNQGWMIRLKSSDLKPLDALMDAGEYQEMIG